jgi:uncharacterized protein YgbK (DUF1537 family)
MNAPLYIIADDFTGSGDSAVQFRTNEQPARLILNSSRPELVDQTCSAYVFNSESRYLSSAEAYDRVFSIAVDLKNREAKRFFKKIDSTLRGNIACEIAAMMAGIGLQTVLVCPAAPRNDRSVVDGICLVEGRPVGSSSRDKDHFNHVDKARIESHFAPYFPDKVLGLGLSQVRSAPSTLARLVTSGISGGTRVFIADAENLDDLRTIAAMAYIPGLLLAGSSGLAEVLARSGTRPRPAEHHASVTRVPRGQTLFMVGSITPKSLAQCRLLEDSGLASGITVDCDGALRAPERELRRVTDRAYAIPASRSVLVRTESAVMDLPSSSQRERGSAISRFLGRVALELASARDAHLVFASGGDTAGRVAEALDVDCIDFVDELLPGVPYGNCASKALKKELAFVCKSGGFGTASTLVDILSQVSISASREHGST